MKGGGGKEGWGLAPTSLEPKRSEATLGKLNCDYYRTRCTYKGV